MAPVAPHGRKRKQHRLAGLLRLAEGVLAPLAPLDLVRAVGTGREMKRRWGGHGSRILRIYRRRGIRALRRSKRTGSVPAPLKRCRDRSEEHTSELQSRFDLVCR